MLSNNSFPIKPVIIDKNSCFFLPSDYEYEHANGARAIKEFMLLDIFAYQDGRYLPQSQGFKETVKFAKGYLRSDEERLKQLHFHNVNHTFHPVKGVLSVGLKLAIIDGIPHDQGTYERIGLACALHDIGNIVQRQRHEKISIDESHHKLLDLGYEKVMIDGIASAIYGTAIDYVDGNPYRLVGSREGKIVSDADLSNPGFYDVTNFAFESIKIWLEMKEFGVEEFRTKGPQFTLQFFDDIGDFHTGAARFAFDENKRTNMEKLEGEIHRIMDEAQDSLPNLMAMIKADDERMKNVTWQ